MRSNRVFFPSEQLNRSQTRKTKGEGREKESREKKRIGGCGGVKDQRIIIFLYIMPFSTPMDTKGKKKICAIAKDKNKNYILAQSLSLVGSCIQQLQENYGRPKANVQLNIGTKRDSKSRIFHSWEEVKGLVNGKPDQIYKSFDLQSNDGN